MDANRNAPLPAPEAMLALSDHAAQIYRKVSDDEFVIETDLAEDRSAIVVIVWFPRGQESDQAEVRVQLGPEGWNDFTDFRIRHNFIHVLKKRLELEGFTAGYVRSKILGVIDAYR